MPQKKSTTVEIDVMSLFTSIDRKLDTMVHDIGMKADLSSFQALQTKVTELEVHGSNNAQRASEGVEQLQVQISGMGWKIAAALGMAGLGIAGQIVLALVRK